MCRIWCFVLSSCVALAACDKPPLVEYPGEPGSSPGTTRNTAPIVDAGADATLRWPTDSIQLAATVSDDGAPSDALRIWWTATPQGADFDDPTAVAPTVRFAHPGTYTLTLTADDGALQASDSLLVTVDAAVYPAADLSDTDPDRGWLRVAPADAGMDAAQLATARAYAQQAGGAGLVSRYGRLVHSWGDIDERFDLGSTTASIGSIALGILLDDGRLRMDDRAAAHLSTIGNPPRSNDAAQLQSITLLQLATHTAGFEKTGAYGALFAAPGTQWLYSDGGLNWLADTVTAVYAGDLQTLLASRAWAVLGIDESDDIRWRDASAGMRPEPRPSGIEHRELAAGMAGNVNALARVGLLFLRRGEWANGQRVFSPSFVELVSTPHPESANAVLAEPDDFPDSNRRYGVLWWTNATGALAGVPHDAFWAWGMGDSLIVVIPSLDLVIARAGPLQPEHPTQRAFDEADWDATYEVLVPFVAPIVAATYP